MEFIPGNLYEVPCAKLRWKQDGIIFYIPVLNHLHADPQFGFPHEHYHIDGRFEIHPRARHWFNIRDGETMSVIVTHDEDRYYAFGEIAIQTLRCERQVTGLAFGHDDGRESLKTYRKWYAGYVGTVCKGRLCPHFGTQMIERDGQLVCPMHKLTADLNNYTILPLNQPAATAPSNE